MLTARAHLQRSVVSTEGGAWMLGSIARMAR